MRLQFSVLAALCLGVVAAVLWRSESAEFVPVSKTVALESRSVASETRNERAVAKRRDEPQRAAFASLTPWGRPDVPAEIKDGPFRESLERLADEPLRRALKTWRALKIPREDQESVRADVRGMLYYVCAIPERVRTATALANSQRSDADRVLTGAAAVPIAKPPVKHSLKGSKNVLYLDFNGHVITGTAWNENYGAATYKAKPYDTDGDPTKFSDAEQAEIIEIWSRVAEDFSPFDVDVTTEEPATFGPTVARAVITASIDENKVSMPSAGGGGIAYIDVFGGADFDTRYSPALIYHTNLHTSAAVAESVSHELGHNLGLSHDGSTGVEYYDGHGSGNTSWGPVMGGAFGANVTQWSKGEYLNASNTEDDIAIIAAKLPLRKTGAGTSKATARALKTSGSKIADKGILTAPTVGDWYSFSTGAGEISLAVAPFRAASGTHGGNADLRIDLLNADGKVVASANPSGKTAASLTYKASKGVYYLRVRGAGEGSPKANPPSGYTSYGSIGQYGISGTFVSGPPVITSPKSASVAGGASFSYQIVATNSPTSFKATGLPAGLKLDKKTGVISGRPTKKGTFSVKLSATNKDGKTGKLTLKLKVKAAAPAIASQSSGSKIVVPGKSTTLKVSAISVSGTAKYQWYLNGKKVSGGTKSSLKAKTTGYYVVKVKNSKGTTTSKPIFVRVAPKKTKVYAWGNNDAGQTKVPSKLTTAVAVAQGVEHSLALKSNGTVVGWGGNDSGQAKPPSGLKKVVDVAAGNYHSVALKSDGTVVAWGNGYYKQTAVPKSLKSVVAIAAGGDHVLALKSNGTVVAWGRNEYGQTKIPKGLKNVIAIAAGDRHSLALKSDGTVVAWGRNSWGQRSVPKGLKQVVEIAAGTSFSIVRKSDGSIVSWGSSFGLDKLPDGVTAVKAIAAGSTHVVAITKDGKAIAFGSSSYGQINVPSKLKKPIAVSAGWWSSIAVHDATK
ncbi:MAG: putative Ig domain-containing protein [Opitutus sp.]|nr:putative Ig domain-containing protein [Opitutus sp.]